MLVKVLVTQLCLSLCDPMDCSPPGSSVHGILQARTLEWVAISFSRGSSWPRDWTWVSCIAGRFSSSEPQGKPFLFVKYIIIWRLRKVTKAVHLKLVSENQNDFYATPISFFFLFFYFIFWPCSMWDLSSPTRNWTCAPTLVVQGHNPWTTREVLP